MKEKISFYVGLTLALLSTLSIGTGFIFKKLALLRVATHGSRAGDGSLLYLCDWKWWVGLSLLATGEIANFAAYALAPASLVTPLGGISVLVCAVLSARYLDEHLNWAGKLGCLICLMGSTMVVLHAPKEQAVSSLSEIQAKFFDPPFLLYASSSLLLAFILFLLGARFGKTNPLIFITISASLGSLSVMACKGLGIGIKEAITVGFRTLLTSWFFYLLMGLLVVGLLIQLYYLNRALDLYNTGLVTALLYVFFTGFVLTASAILYREWSGLSPLDYTELVFAFVFISIGIFMMTVLKDAALDMSLVSRKSEHSSCHNCVHGLNGNSHPSPINHLKSLHYKQRSRRKYKLSPQTRKNDLRGLLSAPNSFSDMSECEEVFSSVRHGRSPTDVDRGFPTAVTESVLLTHCDNISDTVKQNSLPNGNPIIAC